jgi:hypothetical protein
MQQRYCGNCGNELAEGVKFCGNCGSPVHGTVRVPTPEADVQVPRPPSPQQYQQQQQHLPEAEARSETRGPMLVLVGAFLVLGIGKTAMGISSAGPGESMAYRLGVGVGGAIISMLVVAAVWLVVGGIVYLGFLRSGGVTFGQAIFNWPVVVIAAFVALLFVV